MNSERAPDFGKITDVKARKKAFFEYLLPEVKRQNSDIIELRNRIKSELLSDNKMTALKKYYKFKDDASIEDLLSSVDIVPTSLVLAQAAYESSWGRSRFAKHYHNYFGLWCFKKGCGVVPLRRDKKPRMKLPSSPPYPRALLTICALLIATLLMKHSEKLENTNVILNNPLLGWG